MGQLLPRLKNRFTAAAGSVSALQGEAVLSVAALGDANILLVPAERVLTFAVALPLPSHRKRIEALPFAIEDRIAVPVDAVHLALADAARDGLYLATVVDPVVMAGWIAMAEDAGLGDAALMPDALALPLPSEGRWTIMRQPGGRVLARLADGRGFAANEPAFVAMWTAAGKPECDELRAFPDIVSLAIDLRQGAFAVRQAGLSKPLRRLATIAAVGLLAHGAIAAADVVILKSIAAKRGIELQAQLAASAPGTYPGTDPADAALIAAGMLPAGPMASPGMLVPTLARASKALRPLGGAIVYRAIAFGETGSELRLEVNADAATLERARKALRDAGLAARVEGGVIVVAGGSA